MHLHHSADVDATEQRTSTTVVVSGSSTFVLAFLSVAIGRGAAFVLTAWLTRSLTTTVVLVRHSSNAVDKGMAQDARRALGTAPNPRLRAGIELRRGHRRGVIDLPSVGK